MRSTARNEETKKGAAGRKAMLAVFVAVCAVVFIVASSRQTVSKNGQLSAGDIRDAYKESFKYEKMQDYDNAMKAITPVYKAYAEGYTVNLRMGWLYYLKKNYANAIKNYENALTAAPDSIEAKLGASLPLLAQEKYDEVESLLNKVLKVDYYNYTGNLRLAYVLRLEEKYDLATKVAGKMLAIYPTDVSFMAELALDKFAKGDKTGAGEMMWNVLVLDPENVTAKEYFRQ